MIKGKTKKALKFFNDKYVGFTLVELIVVITILAILGTIAFINLQGFGKSARDSVRMSDLGSIRTSLILYNTKEGSYPMPTNPVDITYSGATVWSQGTVGYDTFKKLKTLNKIPLDPLSLVEYTYSTLLSKSEYELAGVLEGDIAFNGLVKDTNASGERIGKTIVIGDYNGKIAKAKSGSSLFILAVPTIISGDLELRDIVDLINSRKLAYDKQSVVPSSYSGSTFDSDGLFDFIPNDILVYTGSYTGLSTSTKQLELLTNVQNAYKNTAIESLDLEIKNITELVIDKNSPSKEALEIAGVIIYKVFKIKSDNSLVGTTSVASCAATPNYNNANFTEGSPSNSGEVWQNAAPSSPCYYVCTNGYTGSSCNSVDPVTCGLSSSEITELKTFFTYGGSSYQYNTAEEWCSLTGIFGYAEGISGAFPTSLGKLMHLETISLSYNNISGSIPSSIETLESLESFSISANSITGTIPKEFGKLTNLESLSLGDNGLTGSIPTELGSLVNLEWLTLNDNNFSGNLPSGLGNLTSLVYFSIYNNSFSGNLPSNLGSLSNLETLTAYNNNFSGAIPSTFGGLSSLEYLNFNDNGLTGLVPGALGNLSNLESLGLSGNNLNKLGDGLTNLTSLNGFSLYGNTALGNLSRNTYASTADATQVGITDSGSDMTIGSNGSNVVITIN